jgi:hypothetical protein
LATIPAETEGGVPVVPVPDPEEHDGRGDAARHGNSEDTDAAFADIVADWQAEAEIPRWPAEEDRTDESPAVADRAYPFGAPTGQRHPEAGDEGHFEPSEPPPFPIPRPRTLAGVTLLAVGILLLVRPSVLSLGDTAGTPLGLLALSAGIGWLVLGLRTGPPTEGWDDGARL